MQVNFAFIMWCIVHLLWQCKCRPKKLDKKIFRSTTLRIFVQTRLTIEELWNAKVLMTLMNGLGASDFRQPSQKYGKAFRQCSTRQWTGILLYAKHFQSPLKVSNFRYKFLICWQHIWSCTFSKNLTTLLFQSTIEGYPNLQLVFHWDFQNETNC